MKKIIMFLLLLLPLCTHAANINNYYINATLNSSGDIIVEEYIEGYDNNYIEKNIYYPNIEVITIGSVPKVKNKASKITGVKEFFKVNVASNESTDIYLVRNDNVSTYLRLYNNDNTKAYYLKYVIKNIAIKYNDTGRLYFKILDNNPNKIKNLNITINIPNNKKAYAFSDGISKAKIINKKDVVEYVYRNVNLNTNLTLNILFDENLLSDSSNISNTYALNIFLDEEKENSNFINNILSNIILILTIINYILLTLYTKSSNLLSKVEKKDLQNILKLKNIVYLGLTLLITMLLIYLKIFGIFLLISNIIISSYIIKKHKNQITYKYLTIMYLLITFICMLNLLKENNIFYLILAILSTLSLIMLTTPKKKIANKSF